MSRPLEVITSDDRLLHPPVPAAGPTLLPAPIASLVSLVSKSTTISIRLGSLVGEVLLDSARASTLTSLELGKALVEGVLIRAGRDVEARRLRRTADDNYVEGWTDKGIDLLHSTVSLTQLLISTGFHLSSTALATASDLAQNYVFTLDSIFGSTESSRAISAIVALIRKEIISADEERIRTRYSGRDAVDAKIGVKDLIAGLTCFAILQMRARKRTDKDLKIKIIWDAMLLDGGKKVSMMENNKVTKVTATGPLGETMMALPENLQTLGRQDSDSLATLLAKLPPSAKVNITTSSLNQQTTTIEITGATPPDFNPPQGSVILSEHANHGGVGGDVPSYKIVYQTVAEHSKRRLTRKDGKLEVEMEDYGDYEPPPSRGIPDRTSSTRIASGQPRGQPSRSKSRPATKRSSHSFLSAFTTDEQPCLYDTTDSFHKSVTEPSSPTARRRSRSKSQSVAPSVYTLRTSRSQSSLVLQYAEDENSHASPAGSRPLFPEGNLCRNMSKFMRFASASYGQNFMRMLGIGAAEKFALSARERGEGHHIEHHAFSWHTNVPVDTILLSSFTDPSGGYDASGETGTGVPLIHFICVDHKAKAVVLTCRGTLGLEDVLTDLTCEYSDLEVRGKTYRVHKGMLNSALLMLQRRSKVLPTISDALQQFPDYGLVLTGHSLGGGVAAILSILLSAPGPNGAFFTSNYKTRDVQIPSGRQIHCYAYGPPACVCSRLRHLTRTLITTTVFGADIVPSLSFGLIRDFYNVAVAFKEDTQGAMSEIRKRVITNLSMRQRVLGTGDDDYLFSILKTLRANMTSEKLVPPGEVYLVETQVVFLKDMKQGTPVDGDRTERLKAETAPPGAAGIKHATRISTKIVRDVEKRFGEIRFGRGMFSDHSPANYESALELLLLGVCDEEVEV